MHAWLKQTSAPYLFRIMAIRGKATKNRTGCCSRQRHSSMARSLLLSAMAGSPSCTARAAGAPIPSVKSSLLGFLDLGAARCAVPSPLLVVSRGSDSTTPGSLRFWLAFEVLAGCARTAFELALSDGFGCCSFFAAATLAVAFEEVLDWPLPEFRLFAAMLLSTYKVNQMILS
jgi:hypothetical protein